MFATLGYLVELITSIYFFGMFILFVMNVCEFLPLTGRLGDDEDRRKRVPDGSNDVDSDTDNLPKHQTYMIYPNSEQEVTRAPPPRVTSDPEMEGKRAPKSGLLISAKVKKPGKSRSQSRTSDDQKPDEQVKEPEVESAAVSQPEAGSAPVPQTAANEEAGEQPKEEAQQDQADESQTAQPAQEETLAETTGTQEAPAEDPNQTAEHVEEQPQEAEPVAEPPEESQPE